MILTPSSLDGLPRPRALDVAAGLGGEIDDHRAGLHLLHRLGCDQPRGGPPGDLGGRDDHVLSLGRLAELLAKLFVLLVGERARVAALALGVLDRLDLEEAAAEGLDLLLDDRADVEAGDDPAEALGGRDRLQARDAGAEDQDLGRRHRPGGRGHHREELSGLARGDQNRHVAAEVGLRGERVHRLGARDPRDRLHREAGDARAGQRLGEVRVGERLEEADQDLALLQPPDLVGGRRARP